MLAPLAKEIDEFTEKFLWVQKTMTTALERYCGCLLVGMQSHMPRQMVHVVEHILGLTVPHLEFFQKHIQDLCFMETIMWEVTQEFQPQLEHLLHPDIDMMVTYVNKLSINYVKKKKSNTCTMIVDSLEKLRNLIYTLECHNMTHLISFKLIGKQSFSYKTPTFQRMYAWHGLLHISFKNSPKFVLKSQNASYIVIHF